MVSAPARRERVAYARDRGLSSRIACALVQVSRSTLGYESRMERRDAPWNDRTKALALENHRYGYRRVRVLLGREGIALSWARAHRLWRKAGLSLPRRRPRRRIRRGEPRPLATNRPTEVWAYDFIFDRCTNGDVIKCLTIVDEGSRECLAIDVAGGIRSRPRRVIEILKRLVAERGAPPVPAFRQRPGVPGLRGAGLAAGGEDRDGLQSSGRMGSTRASTADSGTSA